MVLLFVDYFIEMDLQAKRSFRLLNRGALRFMADIFAYNKDICLSLFIGVGTC